MKTAVLIGYPLAHSITPLMYAPAFAAMGIAARCEKWVTEPKDLEGQVARLRGADMFGANVTVPHKEAVIALLDSVTDSARAIGAVNCIVTTGGGRLEGHNTDKYGFMRSLTEAGFAPKGRRAVVLGAGGAARAVVAGLAEAGIGSISIANRTQPRAEELARDLASDHLTVEVVGLRGAAFDHACAAAGLIVNTTPLGTAHTPAADDSPVQSRHFRRDVMAYDLVYNPSQTPFLRQAREAGARAVSGLDMLIYQGAESIRLWTGRQPPTDIMREAALAALRD